MKLKDFKPQSKLVTKSTRVDKPKFPVIDAHNHLGEPFGGGWDQKPLSKLLDLLDEAKSFYIKTLMPHTRPLDAIKARVYLKQGRLSKAEEWVNKQGLSVEDELVYFREFEHIILAQVLLAEYQNTRDEGIILKALRLLERLLKAAEDGKRLGSGLQILVTQVLAYQAKGDTSSAYASVERTLTLAQPEGYFRIFVDEANPCDHCSWGFEGQSKGNRPATSMNCRGM